MGLHSSLLVNLRQIYHAMLLASWYKQAFKDTILAKVYVDREKISGVDDGDAGAAEDIWQRYVDVFRSGSGNIIQEEYDPASGRIIPRKYFSGGVDMSKRPDKQSLLGQPGISDSAMVVKVRGRAEGTEITAEQTEEVLNRFIRLKNLDLAKIDSYVMRVDGREIPVTQYRHDRDELVPFMRVGSLIIIVSESPDETLDPLIADYPYLIRFYRSYFTSVDGFSGVLGSYDKTVMNHPFYINSELGLSNSNIITAWSSGTLSILAMMVAHQEEISGRPFIDRGAGSSGIFSIAASKLGASKILSIEGYGGAARILEEHLGVNEVEVFLLEKLFSDVLEEDLEDYSDAVVVSNNDSKDDMAIDYTNADVVRKGPVL